MAQTVKNIQRCRFDPWVGKNPWRRKWLPTPVFLPGEFHGQRSLVGGLQSMGLQTVGHDRATNTHTQRNYAGNTWILTRNDHVHPRMGFPGGTPMKCGASNPTQGWEQWWGNVNSSAFLDKTITFFYYKWVHWQNKDLMPSFGGHFGD